MTPYLLGLATLPTVAALLRAASALTGALSGAEPPAEDAPQAARPAAEVEA